MATQKQLDDWNTKSLSEGIINLSEEKKAVIGHRMEKALYDAFHRRFKEDVTGQSKILAAGVPVVPIDETVDLKDLFEAATDTLWRNLNTEGKQDEYRPI